MNEDNWKPEPDVVDLLQQHEAGDFRAHPRFPLMASAWIWRDKSPDAPLVVRMIDHSDGGVGFTCAVALEPGEFIEISLNRSQQPRSRLQVTHCESYNEDTYRVGAFHLTNI